MVDVTYLVVQPKQFGTLLNPPGGINFTVG